MARELLKLLAMPEDHIINLVAMLALVVPTGAMRAFGNPGSGRKAPDRLRRFHTLPYAGFGRGLLVATLGLGTAAPAQTNATFDGRPWNISTGNLSVGYIQASPIGAFPRPDYFEPPPSVESQARLKSLGLVANEDYVAWGAVERAPGQWSWKQHDAMEQALHRAGLKYAVYVWAHFPPVWLRDQRKESRTLMRCLEHGQEANYLSIFDPRTIQWYDHFYKNLQGHFGDKIDEVYACVLGPYGEGNYPLPAPGWVNMGHCHEGYWCGDAFAIKAFQAAMKRKYSTLGRLNRAWGSGYDSFEEIRPPRELADEKFKPSPRAFPTAQDRGAGWTLSRGITRRS